MGNGKVVQKNGKDGIHAATVTGDTIGDPFKDTSGPALNILMKLMTMISLVFAKDQFNGLDEYEMWWVSAIIAVGFMVLTVTLTIWQRANAKRVSAAINAASNETEAEPKHEGPSNEAEQALLTPEE